MTNVDTSAEAVERKAEWLESIGLRPEAATLRALLVELQDWKAAYYADTKRIEAERDRLQSEVASLRITLGGKTFGPDVPKPIGCPMPGACAQVKEINRLKRELAEAIDRGNDWCDQAQKARTERNRLREALRDIAQQCGAYDGRANIAMTALSALKGTGHD